MFHFRDLTPKDKLVIVLFLFLYSIGKDQTRPCPVSNTFILHSRSWLLDLIFRMLPNIEVVSRIFCPRKKAISLSLHKYWAIVLLILNFVFSLPFHLLWSVSSRRPLSVYFQLKPLPSFVSLCHLNKPTKFQTNKVPNQTKKVLSEANKVPNLTNKVPNQTNKVPDQTKPTKFQTNKVPNQTNTRPGCFCAKDKVPN